MSIGAAAYLWQVEYFNTLYPGGLGIDNCAYHDICPGYMMQIDVSNITDLGNPTFSMISTPTTATGNSVYSIYGSQTAGFQGVDLLYSNTVLNDFLPLPGVQTYKYLSIVSVAADGGSGPSGILLEKLQVTAPCPPTYAPSRVPSYVPTIVPSTIAPSTPTTTPTRKPTRMPTSVPVTSVPSYTPSAPTYVPSIAPSAPTQTPTTSQLQFYESASTQFSSSVPVLMHQFKFVGSSPLNISKSCQQFVVDNIQNTTASVCNYVQVNDGFAIFTPGSPVPFIQLLNIVELSDVNAFTVVTWVTLGLNNNFTSSPLFSFGDIRFPAISTNSSTDPYEPLGCVTEDVVMTEMTTVTNTNDFSSCLQYAANNGYSYVAFGSFCRFVVFDSVYIYLYSVTYD